MLGMYVSAPILGMLVVGAAELAVSLTAPGSKPDALGTQLSFAALILGYAAVFRLILAAAQSAVGFLRCVPVALKIRGRRYSLDFLIIFLGAIAFLEWANLTLFLGPEISTRCYAPYGAWFTRIGVPILTILCALFARWLLTHCLRGTRPVTTWTFGLLALLGCGALVATNAKIYRGLSSGG